MIIFQSSYLLKLFLENNYYFLLKVICCFLNMWPNVFGWQQSYRQADRDQQWLKPGVCPSYSCEGQPWVWEETDIDFLGLVMWWLRHLPLIVNTDQNGFLYWKQDYPTTHRYMCSQTQISGKVDVWEAKRCSNPPVKSSNLLTSLAFLPFTI